MSDWTPEPAQKYARDRLDVLCKEVKAMQDGHRVGPCMIVLQSLCRPSGSMPGIQVAIEFVHDAAVEHIAGL